jgi:hypothetical protein
MRPLAMHARPIGNTTQTTMIDSSTDTAPPGIPGREDRDPECTRGRRPLRPTRRAQRVGRATNELLVALR